jgi:hypothetical protein
MNATIEKSERCPLCGGLAKRSEYAEGFCFDCDVCAQYCMTFELTADRCKDASTEVAFPICCNKEGMDKDPQASHARYL